MGSIPSWVIRHFSGGGAGQKFDVGNQPCKNFKAADRALYGYTHVCLACDAKGMEGWVVFCDNCCKDHHGGGYETCGGCGYSDCTMCKGGVKK